MVLSFAVCKVIVKTLKVVGFGYFISFSVVTELVEDDGIFYHKRFSIAIALFLVCSNRSVSGKQRKE